MSRVVLRGASGRMPWVKQAAPAPRPSAPAAAPQTPPAPQAAPVQTPPLPPSPKPDAVKNGDSAFAPWSDARCAQFFRARAGRLLTGDVDTEAAARGLWQYFFRLSNSNAAVGPETRNALVTALCRVGALDAAAQAVETMRGDDVAVLPDTAGELVATYAACGQHQQAVEVLRFFANHPEQPAAVVSSTFTAMERRGVAGNPFARSLLENLPSLSLEAERAHFVSVAKTSPGGRAAYEVLARMKHLGHGDVAGADAHGSLAFACGGAADAAGAEQVVTHAERADSTNTTCYEGLALGHHGTADVQGSGKALERFRTSGHPLGTAGYLLQTVASTAAPHALKGDSYARRLCYQVYDTAMASEIEDKRNIASILQPVVKENSPAGA